MRCRAGISSGYSTLRTVLFIEDDTRITAVNRYTERLNTDEDTTEAELPPKRKEGARRSVGEVAVVDWRLENSGRKREESEAWSASPAEIVDEEEESEEKELFLDDERTLGGFFGEGGGERGHD